MTQRRSVHSLRSRTACPVPAPAAGVALRGEVLDRLSAPGVRVAVVVAPGGYGKTSHVAAWMNDDHRPAAWLDIEDADGDPQLLLSALVDALGSITDFDAGGLSPHGANAAQFATMVAPSFGHAVRSCGLPFLLVLDDVHLLSTPAAADLLDALVCNVPDGSTVVLAGRAAPVASLGRLRAEPGVVEVTADMLALGGEEIERVLTSMGVPQGDIDPAEVLADTEGWPVGVRLLGANWLADASHDGRGGSRLSGRDPHVAEYLKGEWLGELSAEHRDFMLTVSGVDWLSGPLCNAITGRNDSGDVLYRIFNDRMMLIPLDRRAESYRMHQLLREALRAEFERVDSAGASAVSSRASEWFEASGDIDRAVCQALDAGDIDRAARLVVEHTPALFTNGRYATVARWLDAMPRERVLGSSSLCLCAAMSSLGLGDSDATRAWLRLSEHVDRAASGDDTLAHLRLLVFRSLMNTGPVTDGFPGVVKAYCDLPPGIWHAAACLAFGVVALATDDDRAEGVLAEGAEEAAIWGASSVEAGSRALLALIAHSNGDTHRAITHARAARQIVADHDLEQNPTLALVIAVSALTKVAEGDMSGARNDVALSRRHLAYIHNVSGWTNVQARLALTRASLLLGDSVAAEVLLKEVRDCLATQPDATGELRQVAELDVVVRSSRRAALAGPSSLTTAELRVLHYMPTNLTIGDIAKRLYLSRFTIKTHCSAIYRKLAVSSRAEAVDVARASGLLPSSPADATAR